MLPGGCLCCCCPDTPPAGSLRSPPLCPPAREALGASCTFGCFLHLQVPGGTAARPHFPPRPLCPWARALAMGGLRGAAMSGVNPSSIMQLGEEVWGRMGTYGDV